MNNYLELKYPFYFYYIPFNKKNILKNIKEFNPTIYHSKPNNLSKYNLSKYNNSYFIIKENFNKTQYINNITDYFTEQNRITCSFSNNISPLEYWKKYKKDIISNTLKKYKEINTYYLRETIYFNTKLCNNFRITVAMTILNYFKPSKWLDISAGWGDRLLSAIFCKVKYYESCDPNLDLHSGYEKIIDIFVSKTKRKNFIIHKNGFLESQILGKDFDIVFTSPPFFKLEKYSNYKENSIKQFENEKDWTHNFLIKSLIKAYNYLKKDGYMILYMGGTDYIMESMHKLDKIMDYKGIIYFYENKPRAIYVWQKKNNDLLNKLI